MAPTAPTAQMSYQAPPIQTSNFQSPREASIVGPTSFPSLSGCTPRSIVHESPQTAIESPFPASSQTVGERGSRPRAVRVRAIDSTALAKEQIDALFQM
jgi:hypothetical protein